MQEHKTPLSVDEYIEALERMKRSPRDRIGILGELGATGLGGVAGAVIAGTVAAAAGATTLFGSSTLASMLGGILVTTTPVGWVVGGAVLGGAIGYGIAKLVRSGGECDAIRIMNMRELEVRIREKRKQAQLATKQEDKMIKIIEGIQLLVKNQKINQEDSIDLLAGIEKGNITVDYAFQTIQELIEAQANTNE